MKYTLEEKKIIRKYLKNEINFLNKFILDDTLPSIARLEKKKNPDKKIITPEDEEWEGFEERSIILLNNLTSFLKMKYKELI